MKSDAITASSTTDSWSPMRIIRNLVRNRISNLQRGCIRVHDQWGYWDAGHAVQPDVDDRSVRRQHIPNVGEDLRDERS